MKIFRSIQSLQKYLKAHKSKSVGFVPTMGAFHEGHLSLMRKSKKDNDLTVISIFINPIQFNNPQDLKKYPRNFKQDEKLAKEVGVDVVFYPTEKMMYPDNYKTYVHVQGLTNVLCGKTRPGHFQGVTTVVTKLLNIVQPHVLYLGQKDYQQALVLSRMAKDLNMPVKVKVCSIVREKNGLAMSSRNQRLSNKELQQASVVYKSLKNARQSILNGQTSVKSIVREIKTLIAKESKSRIEYIEILEGKTLKPLQKIDRSVVIAVAVFFDNVRLIDNIVVHV